MYSVGREWKRVLIIKRGKKHLVLPENAKRDELPLALLPLLQSATMHGSASPSLGKDREGSTCTYTCVIREELIEGFLASDIIAISLRGPSFLRFLRLAFRCFVCPLSRTCLSSSYRPACVGFSCRGRGFVLMLSGCPVLFP